MDSRTTVSPLPPRGGKELAPSGLERSPEDQMKNGLFAVSKKPAHPYDIKVFQTLHSPRLYSMAEWILQYENARQRQDVYLNEIRDLRQQICTKKRRGEVEPFSKNRRFWTPAWHPMTGHQSHSRGQPGSIYSSSNEACVLFAKDLTPRRRFIRRPAYWSGGYPPEMGQPLPPFHTVSSNLNDRRNNTASNSRDSNRYINIVRSFNTARNIRSGTTGSIQIDGQKRGRLPPIEGHRSLDRHKTDYEPFERLSRRNKLNLTSFLREERARVATQHSIDLSEVRVQATPIPCSR